VTLAPWEYLFLSFDSHNFPDIFHLTWIASLVLLGALIVLYIVRTRALHRHPPYTEMWEWLWWTGLITFSLILIGAVFVFDFFLVLATEVIGIGTLVWIRFRRFPPYLAAYEKQLAKQRYASTRKFSDPDATIRRRGGRRQRRRR
jgi:glucan phosphoethanolaminetransferase (alkaline phosphatase superfamily)